MQCSSQGQALHPVQGILPPCMIPIPSPSLLHPDFILSTRQPKVQKAFQTKSHFLLFSSPEHGVSKPRGNFIPQHSIVELTKERRLKTQNFMWPIFPKCPENLTVYCLPRNIASSTGERRVTCLECSPFPISLPWEDNIIWGLWRRTICMACLQKDEVEYWDEDLFFLSIDCPWCYAENSPRFGVQSKKKETQKPHNKNLSNGGGNIWKVVIFERETNRGREQKQKEKEEGRNNNKQKLMSKRVCLCRPATQCDSTFRGRQLKSVHWCLFKVL